MLGRPPIHGPGTRLRVVLEDETGPIPEGVAPLALGEDIDPVRIRGGGPVEHLLPGSSPAYRRQRGRIAAEYYEIVPR
jgi:hypothetical protein